MDHWVGFQKPLSPFQPLLAQRPCRQQQTTQRSGAEFAETPVKALFQNLIPGTVQRLVERPRGIRQDCAKKVAGIALVNNSCDRVIVLVGVRAKVQPSSNSMDCPARGKSQPPQQGGPCAYEQRNTARMRAEHFKNWCAFAGAKRV